MKKISALMLIAVLIVSIFTFTACNNGDNETKKSVTIQYVSDGSVAGTLIAGQKVDYIVVGEPAATAQSNKLSLNGEMNLQTEYQKVSGELTYPQAGIFVKNSVASDSDLMNELFTKLLDNKTWISANKSSVTTEAKKLYESAVFPVKSIDRCAINSTKIDDTGKSQVITFLKNVMSKDSLGNSIDWDGLKSTIFDYSSGAKLEQNATLKFTAPEGTPALSFLTLATNNQTLDNHTVTYQTVNPTNIASEMKTGKSDIVIMPVNAGANLIKQGANYKLVSIAVNGSLYLVGNNENAEITLNDIVGKKVACIGKEGVPGLIFRYILSQNNIEIIEA